ncbi:helix-turn-helix transcriptional regulator [Bradyrhizobium sp. B117]|uniref:helix-turn-helix domain-containing protein n=1 Tax=Bradyrhizobium sp. B117 TaxID=3140246 RepID=UPI003182EC6C
MVNASEPSISPAQVRAARAWLNWNQDFLARKAGLSKTTLNRFEQGLSILNSETSGRLRKTLEEAGIEFQFRKMVATGISIVNGEASHH